MTSAMFGRSTLTATGVPSGSSAKCTCATDALATGVRSNALKTSVERAAVARAPASRSTSSDGNGGTRSCSFASSSAMSGGSRSRRVDSIWPNLTKIGPEVLERAAQPHARAAATGRARTARVRTIGRRRAHALVAEREVVEPVPQRDDDDPEEPTQPHARIVPAR